MKKTNSIALQEAPRGNRKARNNWLPVPALSRWMTAIAAVVLGVLLGFNLTAQAIAQSIASYKPVVRATGVAYNSISGSGPSYFAWRNTASNQNDDNRSFQTPIGFDFWYLGTRYTQFSAGLNGTIDFSSSTADGNTSPYAYGSPWLNQFWSNPDGRGALLGLAPMYADIWTAQYGTVPIATSMFYQTSGAPGSRVLTVEWLNFDGWNSPVNSDTAHINMQVKIYESTGVIEFRYGTMYPGNSGPPTPYYLRYSSGINGSALSSPPTAPQLLAQETANSATFTENGRDQLTVLPASNSMLTFGPPTPADPSGFSITGVTRTGMTLNWTDNSSNEMGYVIYRSTDGSNYTFLTQLAANSTSNVITGLVPGTTYYWKVYAVTEGRLSNPLAGSQSTLSGGTISSIASGNWSDWNTWDGGIGIIPTAGDEVIIKDTHTVTLDVAGSCKSLTVGQGTSGQLTIGDASARSLTITNNLTVNAFATVTTGATAATHTMSVGGNISNGGTLDLAPTGTRVCNVTFNNNGNQTLSGGGATTRFNLITLNMGTSSSNVLDVTATNFTAAANFLTLTNGTFKLSAGVSLTPYTANASIPLTAGLWVNNSSAIVSTTGGSITLFGTVRATAGTLNIGNASDNSLTSSGGTVIVDGGTVNIAGRLDKVGANLLTYFTMSSGTLTVATFQSTLAGAAPFRMDEVGSTFNMSGGTIIVRKPGAGNLGYVNTGGTIGSVTGGTLQIGDASTPAGQTIQINATIPVQNLLVNNAVVVTAQLSTNSLTVNNGVTINNGSTLNANALNITVGGDWTNLSGTFGWSTGTVIFNGSGAQAINGSAATQTFNNITVNKSANTLSVGGSTTTLTLNGSMTLTAGTLDIGTATAVNVAGNWTNNGAAFTPGAGTVTFTGNSASINGSASAQTFNNLTVNKTAGQTLTVGGSTTTLSVNGAFTQTQGNFTAPTTTNVTGLTTLTAGTFTAGTDLNLTGNWSKTAAAIFTPGSGTVTFNSTTGAQTIGGTSVTQTFNNITVNKSGQTLSVGGSTTTLTLNGSMTLSAGTFSVGTATAINVAGNWTNNGGTFTPVAGTVTFNNTTAGQAINGSTAAQTFFNITINNSPQTLSISGSTSTVTVNGTLTFTSGTITTGSNAVVISSTGTVSRTSGHVIGNLQKYVPTGITSRTFEIGDASSYTPLDVSFANVTVAGNLTAKTTSGDHPDIANSGINAGKSVNRYWTMTNSGVAFTNYSATFTFLAGDVDGGANTNLFIVAENNGSWSLPTVGTRTATSTQATGLTSFGDFQIGEPPSNSVTKTRVTGSANWSTAATWIQIRTGSVTFNGTANVTGLGTLFNTELNVGDVLVLDGTPGTVRGTVQSITDATNLILTAPAAAASGAYGRERVPTASDDIQIGNAALGSALTLTLDVASATVNSMTFINLAQNVDLTHSGSNALTVNGTVAINQPSGGAAIHSWNINAGIATVQGSVTLSVTSSSAGQVARIVTTSGTLTVQGDVVHNNTFLGANSVIDMSGGAGTLNIGGSLVVNTLGTLTPGTTSTVVYNGTGAQTVGAASAITYNHLRINKASGTATLGAATTTNGNVILSAGTLSTGASNFSLTVGGNWTNNGGTFTPGTGTVTFINTTAGQAINGTAAGQTFNNLTINKSGQTMSIGGSTTAVTVNSNLTVSAGTFDLGTATANRGASGGTITVANGATLKIGGTNSFPANYTTHTLGASSTVEYAGTTQTVSLESYGNFTLSGSLAKTLPASAMTLSGTFTMAGTASATAAAALTIGGSVVLGAGTSFNAGAFSHSVGGDWTNNGATFTQNTSTITFNSTTGAQAINGTAATQTFNNLAVSKSGQTLSIGGSTTTLALNGTLTLNAGTVNAGTATAITIAGNWANNGATFTPGSSTVTFNSTTAAQYITGTAASKTFNNITVNKSGQTLSMSGGTATLNLNGTMTLTAGTLDAGTATAINIAGNWTNNSATFTPGNSTVTFTSTTASQSINGTAAAQTFYGLAVNNPGQTLTVGGSTTTLTVSATVTLTAGTFAAGTATAINVAGDWSAAAGTTFTPGSGTVTFNSATGAQAINGSAASQTFNNVTVNKSGQLLSVGGSTTTLTLNGTITLTAGTFSAGTATSINVGGNWTAATGTTFTPGSSTVTFNNTTAAQAINGTAVTQTFNGIIVNKTGQTLSVGGSTTTLSLNGTMTLTAGTFAAGTVATINVAGDWTNNGGTFTPGTGTVTFNSTTAAQAITGTAAAQTFNSITVNKTGQTLSVGGSTTTLNVGGDFTETTGNFAAPATMVVTGNVTLTAGTYTAGASMSVGGNWTNNSGAAAFTAGAGTVNFSGAAQTIAGTAATTFNNLTVTNSGAKTLTTVPTVNGILSMEGTATVSAAPTYGAAATLQYNTATARTAGAEWITPFAATGGVVIANTGAITMNVAKVFNASIPLTINSGATLVTNNLQLTFGGNFVNSGGTFTAGSSPIVITNTMVAQSIAGFTTTGLVSMTKASGTATFTGNVNGAGLTINGAGGGILNLGSGLSHTFTGIVTLTAGTLNGGSSTLNENMVSVNAWSGTGTVFSAGTGTVNFGAAGNQTLSASTTTFNNLTFSTSGTKTLSSATAVNGNLTITGTATLDANASTTTVTGLTTISGGTYLASTAQQTFNGGLTLSGGTFTGSTGNVTTTDVTLNSGTLTAPSGIFLVTGNWSRSGGTFTPGTNTVTFAGAGAQTIGGASTTAFYDLTVNNTNGVTLNSSPTISGTLTLTAGTFSIGANTLTLNGPTTAGTPANLSTTSSSSLSFGGSSVGVNVPSGVTALNDMTVNNVNGVTLTSSPTISGALTSTLGALSVGANTLTLNGPPIGAFPLITTSSSSLSFGGSSAGVNIPSSVTALNNLTINNTNGVTLNSSPTISGTLTTAASTTLSFGTTARTVTLSGTGANTLVNVGTIDMSGGPNAAHLLKIASSSTAFSGMLTTGTGSTVEFTATAGGQTIPSKTYNHLTLDNTSGTNTAGGNLTVNGTLTTTAGGTLDMTSAYTLNGTLSTITNNGTIKTSVPTATSATPIPTGKTWGGAIEYGAAGGAQTVVTGTYNNLTLDNTSGTNAAGGSLTVDGTLTTTAGGKLDMTSAYTLSGTLSTITNNGTIKTSVPTATSATPIPTGKTWGGTIEFGATTGAQTVVAGTYNNLTLDNTSGTNAAGGNLTVNGTLTLSGGNISTGSNTLTMGSTGSLSRTGGHVIGNLAKTVTGTALTPTFEIGDATNYTPVSFTFASVSVSGTLTVTTTSGDHPNIGTSTIDAANSANRYWTMSNTGITFTTYDATFNFVAGDLDAGAVPSIFVGGRYSGGSWTYPTVGTRTATSTEITGVSAFGDIQLGQPSSLTFTSWASGNWSAAGTWDMGMAPLPNADVIIATGTAVTVNVNTSAVKTITIQNTGALNGSGSNILSMGANGGTDFNNAGTTSNLTVKLSNNSQWAGAGTFNLTSIDLNSKTLTLAFAAANTIYLSGSGDPISNPGTLTPGTNSTIEYNGSSAQTVSANAAVAFNNLQISSSSTVTLASVINAAKVAGNLSVASGTFDNGGFAITLANNKSFNVSSGATFVLGGTTGMVNVSGTGTKTFGATSTVNYAGSAQSVSSETYGHLTLSGSGAKTLPASSITVAGTYTISGTASATAASAFAFNGDVVLSSGTFNAGSFTHTVSGNWTNNGATFTAGTSTVTLTGSGKVINGSASTAFSSLTISGSYSINTSTSVNPLMTVTGTGSVTVSNGKTLTITGDLNNDGVFTNNGTVTVN